MKKLLLLLLFIPLASFGQKSNDADALKLCVALQSNNFTTDSEAEDAVNKILSVIGASQKPILQACSNINNAVAAVYKGQRYILYDREFMNSLTAGSNKYWSNMFILAHEIGHHINGHSLDIILYANDVIDPKSLEEKRKQELEADEFAGFVLAKLGASLPQTSKVLLNLPRINNENSSTHPSKDKRIASVKTGYKKGELEISSNKSNKIVIKKINSTEKKEEEKMVFDHWKFNLDTKPINSMNDLPPVPKKNDWKKLEFIQSVSFEINKWKRYTEFPLHNNMIQVWNQGSGFTRDELKNEKVGKYSMYPIIQNKYPVVENTVSTLGKIIEDSEYQFYDDYFMLKKELEEFEDEVDKFSKNRELDYDKWLDELKKMRRKAYDKSNNLYKLEKKLPKLEIVNELFASSNDSYQVALTGFKEFPDFYYSDFYNLKDYYCGWEVIELHLIFEYIIDNKIKGKLITGFKGRIKKGENKDSSEKIILTGYASGNCAYTQLYKFINEDKDYMKNNKKFINGIKKGNNLKLRLLKTFRWVGSLDGVIDTGFEDKRFETNKYTYEFDLKGSSAALKIKY